jgi:glucokinase-like ROK family protein
MGSKVHRISARPGREAPLAVAEPTGVAISTSVELLRMIWKEERISRAEIARRAGLSRSTVSTVVGDLLRAGLVAEVGSGPSRGGRRPIELLFQYDAFGLIGVDIGATHISAVLTNLRGEVKGFLRRGFGVRDDREGTLRAIYALIEELVAGWGRGFKPLVGIGLAVPSPVDLRQPDKVSEVVLPAWKGKGLTEAVRERFKLPVLVDNDANLGALAELWWGAGRGRADSIYIKCATGIGSGHIINGRIYRGASGTAGEIGHLAIDPHGPPCVCGLRGCLVTFVGTPGLLRRAGELLAHDADSALPRHGLTITQLEDAALAGDPVAVRVVTEAADYFGIAVAGLLNLLNPSVVSIGGSLARLGELLLEPLRQSVRTRTLVTSLAAAEIVASELGDRDVAVGAATLLLDAALDDLSRFPAATAA